MIARDNKYNNSKRSRGTERDTLLATPPVAAPDGSSFNQLAGVITVPRISTPAHQRQSDVRVARGDQGVLSKVPHGATPASY